MKQTITIRCAPGTADWVAAELRLMDYPIVQQTTAGVQTRGELDDCMWLNLQLRTAHSVLLEVGRFTARTADELYKQARELPWEKWMRVDSYFSIDAFVRNETIRDWRFASLRLKDAIADRMQALYQRRPDSGKEKDQVVLFLYWYDEGVSLYVDTSGETISKHGYRFRPGKAPLMETIAAGIVQQTRWQYDKPFVNPMCGSGTLAIEAALLATNTPPGLFRENFGFMHLRGYDSSLWAEMKAKARAEMQQPRLQIMATDRDFRAVTNARRNAEEAGMVDHIRFEVCDFADTPLPEEQGGVVILNPEWGERLGESTELEGVYKQIGDFFKSRCGGYWGYIVAGNPALGKHIGLRTSRKIPVPLAQQEGRLLEYELYAGTKRGQ
ncbi:THUMP domain-containing class I SAM-dependent RNA methyltransferase [Cesiribacter andamanensis]|nr:THUMP domain-containing protein [Cesiribacter andamanensis]